MSIGKQLQWYANYKENKGRIEDLDKFYYLMRQLSQGLNGGLKLNEASGKNGWPEKEFISF